MRIQSATFLALLSASNVAAFQKANQPNNRRMPKKSPHPAMTSSKKLQEQLKLETFEESPTSVELVEQAILLGFSAFCFSQSDENNASPAPSPAPAASFLADDTTVDADSTVDDVMKDTTLGKEEKKKETKKESMRFHAKSDDVEFEDQDALEQLMTEVAASLVMETPEEEMKELVEAGLGSNDNTLEASETPVVAEPPKPTAFGLDKIGKGLDEAAKNSDSTKAYLDSGNPSASPSKSTATPKSTGKSSGSTSSKDTVTEVKTAFGTRKLDAPKMLDIRPASVSSAFKGFKTASSDDDTADSPKVDINPAELTMNIDASMASLSAYMDSQISDGNISMQGTSQISQSKSFTGPLAADSIRTNLKNKVGWSEQVRDETINPNVMATSMMSTVIPNEKNGYNLIKNKNGWSEQVFYDVAKKNGFGILDYSLGKFLGSKQSNDFDKITTKHGWGEQIKLADGREEVSTTVSINGLSSSINAEDQSNGFASIKHGSGWGEEFQSEEVVKPTNYENMRSTVIDPSIQKNGYDSITVKSGWSEMIREVDYDTASFSLTQATSLDASLHGDTNHFNDIKEKDGWSEQQPSDFHPRNGFESINYDLPIVQESRQANGWSEEFPLLGIAARKVDRVPSAESTSIPKKTNYWNGDVATGFEVDTLNAAPVVDKVDEPVGLSKKGWDGHVSTGFEIDATQAASGAATSGFEDMMSNGVFQADTFNEPKKQDPVSASNNGWMKINAMEENGGLFGHRETEEGNGILNLEAKNKWDGVGGYLDNLSA